MKAKWHQRVTVQAALITAAGVIAAGLITAIVNSLKREPVPTQVTVSPVIIILPKDANPEVIARALQGMPIQNTLPNIATPTPIQKELVLLLVDTSASMRRQTVVNAVTEYVSKLDGATLRGLVTFDENAVNVLSFGYYPPEKYREILSKLTERAGMFTDIRAGVKTAVGTLDRIPGPAKRLVLFTDGFNEPRSAVSTHATPEKSLQFDNLDNISFEVVILGDSVPAKNIEQQFPQAKSVSHYPGS